MMLEIMVFFVALFAYLAGFSEGAEISGRWFYYLIAVVEFVAYIFLRWAKKGAKDG